MACVLDFLLLISRVLMDPCDTFTHISQYLLHLPRGNDWPSASGVALEDICIWRETSHNNITVTSKWAWLRLKFTSLTIIYSTINSGADLRNHQSSASLAFVQGIHRSPVNSPQQRASYAETVSIWWRHHETTIKRNKAWTVSTAIHSPGLVDASLSGGYEIWLVRLDSVSIDFGGCLQLQWNLDTFVMHSGLTWQTGIHTGFQWPLTQPCRETICSWWRHQMEAFSALLALCAGNSPVTGEFPPQRPVTRSFDVFFDLRLNKRLSKQSWGWWFEMPSRPLWRHQNAKSLHSTVANIYDCVFNAWCRMIIIHADFKLCLILDSSTVCQYQGKAACLLTIGNHFPVPVHNLN